MAVTYDVGTLWHNVPGDLARQMARSIDAAMDSRSRRHPVDVFFRADDVAVPSGSFNRLMALFIRHQIPLALAIVPAWLTNPRWEYMRHLAEQAPTLWNWHQHGWCHANHEPKGKKQEFGPARGPEALSTDLTRGRQRLEMLLGERFVPIFTPPWNRCSQITLELLATANYLGVSRSDGATPRAPQGLTEINVNVDLHTRRKMTPAQAWPDLWQELQGAIQSGQCGFMIHHQRMNPAAFEFLNILLTKLARHKQFRFTSLKELTRRK